MACKHAVTGVYSGTKLLGVLTGAALLLQGAPVLAQEKPLSFPEAISNALATSESLQGAEAKVQGARSKIDEAQSHRLPSLSVGVTPVYLGVIDNRLSGMLRAAGISSTLVSETVTVSQVLYDGGRIGLGSEAAKEGVAMSEQGSRLARQNVAFETANAYLNVLRAESLLNAATLTQKQAEQHLKDAKLRERTGMGSQFETLQAQTALINTQGQVVSARNAVKLSRLSLGTQIHQELGDRPLNPPPTFSVPVDDQTMQRGIEQRPEIALAKHQIQLDTLTKDISGREDYPVAAVQGLAIGQGLSIPAYVIMGSLNWTLFDGGKTSAKVRQGEKAVEADQASLNGLRRGMRLEVEKAIADREDAREHMVISEQGLKMANAAYNIAGIRYSKGAGSGTEVIDATTTLSQAQAGFIASSYEKIGAELRLAKALGLDLGQLLTKGQAL